MTDTAWETIKEIIGIIAIATVTIVIFTSACECEKERLKSFGKTKHEEVK